MVISQVLRKIIILCAFSIPLCLAGCCIFPTNTKYSDLAHVYVSAYPPVPWSDIKDKLEPKNKLSITDARTLATETTQQQVFQFLSSFAVGLGLGLPTRTENLITTLPSGGTASTTGTITRTSGNVPSSSGTPSTSITSSTLTPDLSKGLQALGVDGSTVLTAGTALYQQAQILDNQLSKEILPDGYQAYLITLQVNLQPRQRNVSYDAYTDVSLLPGSWEDAVQTSKSVDRPPIIVYPLVIMDAMETTNVGRTIEAIRQASLALSGVIGNVGANLGVGGGTAKAYSIAGLDKNSLITVGRINDYTVRIRFGAENSGSAGLALVPRTYNVSLVVLTRWEYADPTKSIKSLQAIAHTRLQSTEDGSLAPRDPERSRAILANRVAERIREFGYHKVGGQCATFKPKENNDYPDSKRTNYKNSKLTPSEIEENLNLLRAIDREDYRLVKNCMGLKKKMHTQKYIHFQRFLARVTEIEYDSDYSTFQILLRQQNSKPILPYKDQIALYSDDKKQTTIVLRGGKALDIRHVMSALQVKSTQNDQQKGGNKQHQSSPDISQAPDANLLLPTDISIAGDGSQVDIKFPSLSQAGLAPNDQANKGKPLIFAICKKRSDCNDDIFKSPESGEVGHYALKATKAKEESVKNPVSASSDVLVADQNNIARVTLQVGAYPDATKFTAPLYLVVKGADVRADSTIGAPGMTSQGVALPGPNSVVTLELGNLTPANLVTLITTDKGHKTIGEPTTFTVVRFTNTAK